MKAHARRAFAALQKINAPVYDRQEYGAHFILGGELRDGNDSYFADYYQEELRERYHPDDAHLPSSKRRILNAHGIRTDVHEILAKHGLYAEWINPGMCGVYDQ